MRLRGVLLGLALTAAGLAWGQPNGQLQIHFIDVGQSDAVLIISPLGETVLIDGGGTSKKHGGHAERADTYLKGKVKDINYYVVSHFHDDHIAYVPHLLSAERVSHMKWAYDRGETFTGSGSFEKPRSPYGQYTNTLGKYGIRRKVVATSGPNSHFALDAGSGNEVEMRFVAVNGNGVIKPQESCSENDLSVVCLLSWGGFRAIFGGDLSGRNESEYRDIETSVSTNGFDKPVAVYKVHHHGSKHSSNPTWVTALDPVVGIICCGSENDYGHPTASTLTTLAKHHVDTYWTEAGTQVPKLPTAGERGARRLTKHYVAVPPDPSQHQYLGGNIVIEVSSGADTFDVIFGDGPGKTKRTYSITKPANDWGKVVRTQPVHGG
jgi:beta-lactamase superfamily II metal-dependent hydrolase